MYFFWLLYIFNDGVKQDIPCDILQTNQMVDSQLTDKLCEYAEI